MDTCFCFRIAIPSMCAIVYSAGMAVRLLSRFILLIEVLTTFSVPRDGFGPGKQDWGFTEVRPGAHMFWWLYYTTDGNVQHYADRPLLVWLQGGPGVSSTGYGNFEEIGLLDSNLHDRHHAWVKKFNVLFVDNPVGTGFSYVESKALLTKDNKEIGQDLVIMMQHFYRLHFHASPLHIFSESYGGRMAVEFAYGLDKATKQGAINCNLKSVALGAPWISPRDSILSWGPFLFNLGFVDTKGFETIQKTAESVQGLAQKNDYKNAIALWRNLEQVVSNATIKIDCYNVLTPQLYIEHYLQDRYELPNYNINKTERGLSSEKDHLEGLMRGPVSTALEIPDQVSWGVQKTIVFNALADDFMKPAAESVELLLNDTSLEVISYTGQLDLIVSTPGTVRWVENLRWSGKNGYLQAPRLGIWVSGFLEGYTKSYGKLSIYWIIRAGHMAPVDNPMCMQHILQKHLGI
ncbi:retinoid-inducible serine carboxypeptidase-like isoform X2 [Wyeomyia smithii]|uniref:retinoid-inducible serine carboxypeptidase-like isoform X2 n=1 Tax=Wyeomyia smithii TaxID=174621 RepID=UPI002467F3D1|nr:retinoid-inducible serine carboxypeptidase-like isoform X2 [Wyeomyia smithii]